MYTLVFYHTNNYTTFTKQILNSPDNINENKVK